MQSILVLAWNSCCVICVLKKVYSYKFGLRIRISFCYVNWLFLALIRKNFERAFYMYIVHVSVVEPTKLEV